MWNEIGGDREIERDVAEERREEGTKRTMINLDEGKKIRRGQKEQVEDKKVAVNMYKQFRSLDMTMKII